MHYIFTTFFLGWAYQILTELRCRWRSTKPSEPETARHRGPRRTPVRNFKYVTSLFFEATLQRFLFLNLHRCLTATYGSQSVTLPVRGVCVHGHGCPTAGPLHGHGWHRVGSWAHFWGLVPRVDLGASLGAIDSGDWGEYGFLLTRLFGAPAWTCTAGRWRQSPRHCGPTLNCWQSIPLGTRGVS